jgi:hemolysin D
MQNNRNSLPALTASNQSEESNILDSVKTSSDAKDWSYGTEELLDALPRRWTRSLLYLLICFSAFALPWVMFSGVDETGSARGRIEPLGATQRLDAQVSGNVTGVKVKEGDTVKAGQLLLELDRDVLQTDLQQVKAKLDGLVNRLAQLDLLKNQLQIAVRTQEQQNKSQELEKQAQVNQVQQNLDTKQSTYNLQKLEKQALVEQAKQNVNATQTIRNIASNSLKRDLKEVKRFQKLQQDGAVPQVKVVELEKAAEESQQLYSKAQADTKQAQLRFKEEENRYQGVMRQASSDIQQAKLRLKEQENSYKSLVHTGELAILKNQEQLKDLQAQITTAKSEINQTKSQIKSLLLQIGQRIVRSPVDGVVFDLPIKKPGTVVQPGQVVAQIAPRKIPLVLKANMPSQQSGFLKKGNLVKIKFDAYPFQDYGVLAGRVIRVSPDSKLVETSQGKIETFELDISLDKPYIQSGNKRIPLTAGQTATAEVIVRQRRLIDFILDPFKKLQKGGLEL